MALKRLQFLMQSSQYSCSNIFQTNLFNLVLACERKLIFWKGKFEMDNEGMKQLLVDGIHAVQGACAQGRQSADEIEKHATDPQLKAELRHGTEVAERWRQRLESAERATGDSSSAPTDNEIVKAIQHTGEKVSRHAKTDVARDLGIVAAGQLALHYYIASFGTLRSYAEKLGLQDTASAMAQCLEEAKAEDEKHTKLAGAIAGR